ncbi:hypothetical protein Mal64_12190 [Pseudobythopirellula maris]|uniref:Uncharacterized protein n=1 Tax=Pseudobythopirellula maris TaxID=2527991 RepID=A0A5C5ZTI7_9BACT|nr:hypothetical protein [Pseudobythopirellula maris]TWT90822.1 hypothetical protein Mal64_12190 [Pseudobythopirellula maris]
MPMKTLALPKPPAPALLVGLFFIAAGALLPVLRSYGSGRLDLSDWLLYGVLLYVGLGLICGYRPAWKVGVVLSGFFVLMGVLGCLMSLLFLAAHAAGKGSPDMVTADECLVMAGALACLAAAGAGVLQSLWRDGVRQYYRAPTGPFVSDAPAA